jgi:hypothetical protein
MQPYVSFLSDSDMEPRSGSNSRSPGARLCLMEAPGHSPITSSAQSPKFSLIYLGFWALVYLTAELISKKKKPLKCISSRFFPHFSPPLLFSWPSPSPSVRSLHRVGSPEQSRSPTICFSSKKNSRPAPDLPYNGTGFQSNSLIYLTGRSAKQRFTLQRS